MRREMIEIQLIEKSSGRTVGLISEELTEENNKHDYRIGELLKHCALSYQDCNIKWVVFEI